VSVAPARVARAHRYDTYGHLDLEDLRRGVLNAFPETAKAAKG
jgi:hypothetical protein